MPTFEQSVFINCPFDDDYAPILQAVSFCVTLLGFIPRLAPENADNAESRLDRIVELVRSSKYGIHDLSRCKAAYVGEYARMNMPFELGLDFACRKYGGGHLSSKALLVLEAERYEYQRTLSDIAGWDIRSHRGEWQRALGHTRDWLVAGAGAPRLGRSKIQSKYFDFQEWYYERELAAGSSEADIQAYPNTEVLTAMTEWMALDQPTTFD